MVKIDHYIQTNLDKNIDVHSAANYIGMSVGFFSRFFNAMFHCCFGTYLTLCRVNFASKLLVDSDLSIIDVCFRSGFNDQSQFNRKFKKEKKRIDINKKEDRYQWKN